MQEEMSQELKLKSFLECGIYRLDLDGSKVAFLDPVRILNRSYSRFSVSPAAYYSRSFDSSTAVVKSDDGDKASSVPKKRKRRRQPRDLNEREKAAEKRHQEARSLLLNAHKAFAEAKELQILLPKLVKCEGSLSARRAAELNFVQLGSQWQAPLYEISLCFKELSDHKGGCGVGQNFGSVTHTLFDNLIFNETNDDVEAHIQKNRYILPSKSCFYMSELRQVHSLVPDNENIEVLSCPNEVEMNYFTVNSRDGFNFIVIDPPWENSSAYQKSAYPTLPNNYFLYLPVKELAHEEGSLVALWITNREKLRIFVENDLFPAWGVRKFSVLHWLKVKPDGSLISQLDLFHHRPYECLLVGYINLLSADHDTKTTQLNYLSNQVIVSIPGDYSRKPPLGRPKPAKCIELFARELAAGWTSWGNEPLHFQDSNYFVAKDKEVNLKINLLALLHNLKLKSWANHNDVRKIFAPNARKGGDAWDKHTRNVDWSVDCRWAFSHPCFKKDCTLLLRCRVQPIDLP